MKTKRIKINIIRILYSIKTHFWVCALLCAKQNTFKTQLEKMHCLRLVSVSIYSSITKTCLYNFDPFKPHFYIVKLGFTGVYIIFLISAQKHRLWVLVRTVSSRRF